jgi:hypothetical protein
MSVQAPSHEVSTQARRQAPAEAGPRLDLYAGIHKALRLLMTRTLTAVGSTDPADAAEVAATLQQVDGLLGLCELHLKDENEFVHPALERALPGSSARVAGEHLHHEESIADLRDLAALVAHSADAGRHAALHRLYHALALFVADNLQHMHVEETAHNAVLWAHCGDAELAAIEQQIVASIPPDAMAAALHGFFPALNAPERAGMLAGMREGMPAEAFAGVLGIAERTLGAADFAKLQRDLQRPVPAHLKTT